MSVARSVWLGVVLACIAPMAMAASTSEADRTLGLIRSWVQGVYDNAAQAEADLADPAVPDDYKHRVMHQLFVPLSVPVPGIPGYLVFQQSSVDGSEDPEAITRVGLLQFLPDPATGMVRQRELNFVDLDAWKNAHRNPQRFRSLSLSAFQVDPGCDFELRANPEGTEVQGPMPKGNCRFFSPGLKRELIADDAVWIRPAEYWFLGRFVDASGAVMFGNASPEPVKLVRKTSP